MDKSRLTPHEQRLVGAVVAGCSNKEIAQRFGTREQTVKNQLSTVFHKLEVPSRLKLAVMMRPAAGDDLAKNRP